MISAPILARREPMPSAIKKPYFALPSAIVGFTFAVIFARSPHLGRMLLPHGMYQGAWDLVPAFLCTIAIHEIGHALAGLLVGFEFLSLRAWPLTVTSVDGRLRIGLSFELVQNQTIMFPRRFGAHRRNMLVYSCGGITANALTVAIVIAMVRAVPSLESPFLVWLGVVSLYAGLANAVPSRGAALYSDGAVFIDAAVRSARYLRSVAFMQMARAHRSGARGRDLDPVLVDQALALTDASRMELLAHVIAYSHFVTLDCVVAERHLESALALAARAAPSDRLLLATECVIFAGYYCSNESVADAWAKTLTSAKLAPHDRLRIDASLAWAGGNRDEAIAIVERLIAEPTVARLWYRDSFIADCRGWIAEMTDAAVAVPS